MEGIRRFWSCCLCFRFSQERPWGWFFAPRHSPLFSRAFSAILFGISPLDPSSFVGVPLFRLAVALLASYIPARRAMRVYPMMALRHE
jgi:hypothetical protein